MVRIQALVPVPVSVVVPAPRPYRWRLLGSPDHPAAPALRAATVPDAPPATAVLLGTRLDAADNSLLLEAARQDGGRVAVLHHGAGGGALLRVAGLENPRLSTVVIELPERPLAPAVHAAVAAAGADRLAEDRYADGLRVRDDGGVTVTGWRPAAMAPALTRPPRPDRGTAVVTGGLGGLGIRVSRALAHRYGFGPVLILDTTPADRLPPAIAHHLNRLRDTGSVLVRRVDVTDTDQVDAALAGTDGPPVSALVHCAGILRGGPLRSTTVDDLLAVQAAKVAGLRNVLAALDPVALRHLIVFGSITAEQPHHQLGCYALGNELLRRAALCAATGLPAAATVVAEWAIWSGAGMAHDMQGAVAQARRLGMIPVPVGPGTATLGSLLNHPNGPAHAARMLLIAGPAPLS